MIKSLKRINELAAIAKERDLSEDELRERDNLRKEYLREFREGFKEQLLNTKVVDENGNDVSPEALKKARNKIKEDSSDE